MFAHVSVSVCVCECVLELFSLGTKFIYIVHMTKLLKASSAAAFYLYFYLLWRAFVNLNK